MKIVTCVVLALLQQVGSELPALKLKSVEGKTFDLVELNRAGVIIAVVSWSEKCPSGTPTRERLMSIGDRYADEKRVLVLGVNSFGDSREEVSRQAQAFRFPLIQDEDKSVGKAFGAKKVNSAYVYKDGKLFWHGGISPRGDDGMDKAIDAAFKGEAAPPSGRDFVG
jgi:peroxiredoxin